MEKQQDYSRFQPAKVRVIKGKLEAWCSCGKSLIQPFCDGTHRGTTLKPVKFTPDEDRTVFLCMCKHSKNPPYCDGSHENLFAEDENGIMP